VRLCPPTLIPERAIHDFSADQDLGKSYASLHNAGRKLIVICPFGAHSARICPNVVELGELQIEGDEKCGRLSIVRHIDAKVSFALLVEGSPPPTT
jgi:hypothetical protein